MPKTIDRSNPSWPWNSARSRPLVLKSVLSMAGRNKLEEHEVQSLGQNLPQVQKEGVPFLETKTIGFLKDTLKKHARTSRLTAKKKQTSPSLQLAKKVVFFFGCVTCVKINCASIGPSNREAGDNSVTSVCLRWIHLHCISL